MRLVVRTLTFLLGISQAGLQGATFGTLRLEQCRQIPIPDWPAATPSVAGRALPAGIRSLKPLSLGELRGTGARLRAVALPRADTRAAEHLSQGRFGLIEAPDATRHRFTPGMVLVQFKGDALVSAIGVENGQELAAAIVLGRRADVDFSELDIWQYPAYQPNDPLLEAQWHHGVVGSFEAWDLGLGNATVRIAIVDTPFQMDHLDLVANTSQGWDIVTGTPISSAAGIEHSTLAAGLAAGIVGNGIGVAGAGNCRLLPINISDTHPERTVISQMYDAVIWAADNGVRVVNMSWTGGDSDTLNSAGAYLRDRARGILVMPAGNLGIPAYTTNQPDICCVSMTDSADNMSSLSGVQVDFAAPGWDVFSTTLGHSYGLARGTSYSSPLLAGVVAHLFALNELLGPEEVSEILKTTAADLGPPGWDLWFGWGRINSGAAARLAHDRLPRIEGWTATPAEFRLFARFNPAWSYTLWRSEAYAGGSWSLVPAREWIEAERIHLADPSPPIHGALYRMRVTVR